MRVLNLKPLARWFGGTVWAVTFLGFGLVSQAEAQGTVVIGKETKKTAGTVIGMEAGDVACYLSLKDEQGRSFQEFADFSVCEQTSLVGKRVTLTYELGQVMADECQGNPDCKKTRKVAIVMAARPVSMGQTSFCTPKEEIVFACRTGSKLVSVCASKDAAVKKGYLQYRFGKPDSRDPLELMHPAADTLPSLAAEGENVPFAGGGGSWLRFRKGDTAYVVYTGIGKWGPKGETMEKEGIVVEQKGRQIANLVCSSELTSALSPDWFEKTGIQPKDEEFLFPDPPATKKR